MEDRATGENMEILAATAISVALKYYRAGRDMPNPNSQYATHEVALALRG